MSAAQNESDGDPTASDGQVPDAPARPKMKENDAPNGRHQHFPPEATTKEDNNAYDSAATDAHDAQVPDALARPTTEENATSGFKRFQARSDTNQESRCPIAHPLVPRTASWGP